MNNQDNILYFTAKFSIFNDVGVALSLTWELEFLELDSENNFQPVKK